MDERPRIGVMLPRDLRADRVRDFTSSIFIPAGPDPVAALAELARVLRAGLVSG